MYIGCYGSNRSDFDFDFVLSVYKGREKEREKEKRLYGSLHLQNFLCTKLRNCRGKLLGNEKLRHAKVGINKHSVPRSLPPESHVANASTTLASRFCSIYLLLQESKQRHDYGGHESQKRAGMFNVRTRNPSRGIPRRPAKPIPEH